MATAATSAPVQSVSPLIAVSVFGTQASAEAACSNAATATAQEGQAGCVLPATDTPPPPPQEAVPPPRSAGLGISPILLGLLGIAVLAALIASGNGDSNSEVSPS